MILKPLSKIFVFIIFCIISLQLWSVNVNVNGLKYSLDVRSAEASVIGVEVDTTTITIPESVEHEGRNYIVNCIGDRAFMGEDVVSVFLPSTIVLIKDDAFANCSSLITLNIPESVRIIGKMAFYGCTGLTSITIPDAVTSLGPYAFGYCSQLEHITIGTGLSQINQFTFYNCGLEEVSIPTNVSYLGDRAFALCQNLTSIIIPDNITQLGLSVFENCENLVTAKVSNNIKKLNGIFSGCTKLQNVELPSNLLTISGFSGCSSLESIIIPQGVKEIESYAFYNCVSLQFIDIPDSVEAIGDDAFARCNQLKMVNLKEGLLSIGNRAFQLCESLKSINLPNSVTSIGIRMFNGCQNLASAIIGDGIKVIPENTFAWCGNLDSLTVGRSVSEIGFDAFFYCSSLDKIIIKDMRSWCQIYSAQIPFQNNHHIFFNDKEITEVVVPDGVSLISSYAFSNCGYIKSVSLPNSIQSIGNFSFYNCKELESVSVGSGINGFGSSVFEKCSNLTDFCCYKQEPLCPSEDIFYETNIKNGTLYVHAASIGAYKQQIPWNSFNSILSIEKYRVQYVLNNEVIAVDSCNAGSLINIPVIDKREGFTLKWDVYPQTMPPHDLAITGTFIVNKYLVKYMYLDKVLKTDSVAYGTPIPLPEIMESGTTIPIKWMDVPETMPAHDIIIQADETNAVLELSNKKQTNGYFQPNGLRLLAPKRKDLNIIRYSDGTTRKVMVK